MQKLSLKDLSLKGKKVLMRVDYNVPLDGDLNVVDATRIKETLPSIRYILDNGGRLVLMSHLGRPEGEFDPELSLAPCAKVLSALVERPVKMAPDVIHEKTTLLVENLGQGEIVLLENLRFYRAEEFPDEDPSFAKKLATYGDLYVNDAFAASHRKHSSTYTVANYFKDKAAAGFLMEKEIVQLNLLLRNPKRPFDAIIGGAKVSSKIHILKSLVQTVDSLLLGGGMAFTFLKAKGINVGKTKFEDNHLSEAVEVMEIAKKRQIPLLLPVDAMAGDVFGEEATPVHFDMDKGIDKKYMGMDIGPKTIDLFSNRLKNSKVIFWNGPLGVTEFPQFAKGTRSIAEVITNGQASTCIGGGDLIAAIQDTDVVDKITHISTGGGATLEFIEKGSLPGIDVLSDKKNIENQRS